MSREVNANPEKKEPYMEGVLIHIPCKCVTKGYTSIPGPESDPIVKRFRRVCAACNGGKGVVTPEMRRWED